jgi:hypothetical protein
MANKLAHAAERQGLSIMLDGLLKHLDNKDNKEETYMKLVDSPGNSRTATHQQLDAGSRAALKGSRTSWVKRHSMTSSEHAVHIRRKDVPFLTSDMCPS